MNEKLLRQCLEHKVNALLIGRHGVGKTQVVKSLFNERYGEMGKDWLYFSASTIDPWVDLIGIPKEKVDSETNEMYLDFVRPRSLSGGNIKAIFLDELNRAHPKVTNAVMELIQFRSINGKPFEGLEVVWAGINPHEADQEQADQITYTVQQLDPALKDRFEYHVNVPYQVNETYFIKKFGEKAGGGACSYWNELKKEHQLKISPRRLEGAVKCLMNGMAIANLVIPKECNSKRLSDLVLKGSPLTCLKELVDKPGTQKEFKDFFDNPSNFSSIKNSLDSDILLASKVLNYVPVETVTTILSDSDKIQKLVFETMPENFEKIIQDVADHSLVSNLKNLANLTIEKLQKTAIKLPKDITKIAYAKPPSKNILNKIDNLNINNYKINSKAINSYRTTNNLQLITNSNKKLQISFARCNTILCNPTISGEERKESIAAVNSIFGNELTQDELIVLLTLLDHFAGRSQTPTLQNSNEFVLMFTKAIALLEITHGSSTLFELKSTYPNLYSKFVDFNFSGDTLWASGSEMELISKFFIK